MESLDWNGTLFSFLELFKRLIRASYGLESRPYVPLLTVVEHAGRSISDFSCAERRFVSVQTERNVIVTVSMAHTVYINLKCNYKEEPHTNIKDLPKVQVKRLHRQW